MMSTPPLPPMEVLLGPSGSGKSAACLERYRAEKSAALLVVPSREYADRLRRRLLSLDPHADVDGIIPFTEAAKELAKAIWPNPDPIRRSQQWLILSDIFEQAVREDAFFRRMRDAPGFISALSESLRELKLSGILPHDLEAAAVDLLRASESGVAGADPNDPNTWLLKDEAFPRKIKEIAQLYAGYQRFITENGLLDEEEVYRLAVEASPKVTEGRFAPRLVIVDGFFRLSRLWRDLLASLAGRGAQVLVTLPADRRRPVLFATPLRTLEAFGQEFCVTERWLERPLMSPPGRSCDTLTALESRLFDPSMNDERRPEGHAATPRPEPAHPPVLLFDAPNRYSEVEMVARSLVRENNQRSVPWSDCAVIVRSVNDYAALLSGVFSRYGVPHAFRRGRPLPENGAVRTLMGLLRIYVGGWQRDDVIAFLRSDRVPTGGIGFDFARSLARKRGAREGSAGWRGLLPEIERTNSDTYDVLRRLLDLEADFPAGPQRYDTLGRAVRQAIAVFALDQPEGNSDFAREDRAAMKTAIDAVDQILAHARRAEAEPITFSQFHRRLVALWRSLSYMPIEPRDAVSIIEPYDEQQLRPRTVFVLGLTERVFPRRVKDDPFFRDDERIALSRYTSIRLEPQRARSDDERLLYYMAVTAPTERLVLSYPRSSEESDTLPSFFLDETRAALESAGERLPAIVRMLNDVAPSPEECVDDRDRLLAACAEIGDGPAPDGLTEQVSEIVATRSRPPVPTLGQETTAAYAAPHRFSVTEVETYNRCPLQHFLRYGLKLRAEADGAGPMDRGALHHDALRRAFRSAAAAGHPSDPSRLKETLVGEMVACLNERTVDARPHRRALMERAVKGALETCAEREHRYRDVFAMTPTHFELAFGMTDEESAESDEERSRDYDPASSKQPLIIMGEDGTVIHLCGAIDRVDLGADGRTAMVLDYKMGSTKEWADIKEGKSIQVPLYLMAVEQVWGMVGAVGCYDSPRDSGRRRFYRKECVDVRAFQPLPGVEDGRMAKPVCSDEFEEAVGAAERAVRNAVSGIQEGRILPTPGEYCRFCDYIDVCRTTSDGAHDGEPLPPPPDEDSTPSAN